MRFGALRRLLLSTDRCYRTGFLRYSRLFSSNINHEIESDLDQRAQVSAQSDAVVSDAPPPPEEAQRILRAAVIGTPNVGKSTLVNQLLGEKLFAVSSKVHTTIRKAMGVFTEGNTQVVLLDTPGIVPYQYGRKLHLPRQFMTDPANSLTEADLIVVMVDAADKRAREQLHPDIVSSLRLYSHLPSLLVLNKVDAVQQKHLLLFVAQMLTGSLDSQSKLKQLRALRGKLRDGTIRGKSSIQAAKLEIERLESELKISSEEESSAMEFGKDGDETSRLDAAAPDILDRRVDPVMSTNTVSVTMGYSRDEFERRSSQNGGACTPDTKLDETTNSRGLPLKTPGKLVAKRWAHFDRVFMVSALTGDGMDDLKRHLLSCAKPGAWEYSPSDVTDLPPLTLVEDVIREKLFHHYDMEIPYVTRQENVLWEWSEDDKELTIYQNLICHKPSQASILIGPRGDTIQTVIAEAREDIERLLKCTVDLTIYVKTAKKK